VDFFWKREKGVKKKKQPLMINHLSTAITPRIKRKPKKLLASPTRKWAKKTCKQLFI
jgi:hypothetical protein